MRKPISKTIQEPYPIIEESEIINGFGRGSAELGIPTANVQVSKSLEKLNPGIYFGYARVLPAEGKVEVKKRQDGHDVEFNKGRYLEGAEKNVLPIVMSIGYNPFYGNEVKAAEIHIIKQFSHTFYGAKIKYVIAGYVRDELDYTTKEALIDDIHLDIKLSLEALENEDYQTLKLQL